MCSNLEVILVSTRYPQNIGFVARSIKNMGFSCLKLVNPVPFDLKELKLYAVHAGDVVDSIQVYGNLKDAVDDSSYTVGFTARNRRNMEKCSFIREKIDQIARIIENRKTAFIFGPEDTGLTNDELELCQLWLKIPASELFESLNLSQAVMIALYELYMNLNVTVSVKRENIFIPAPLTARSVLYSYMADTFRNIGIQAGDGHESWVDSVMRILDRRDLSQSEINTFMGLLKELRNIKRN